ncbi:AraC family transcriptional regulator [Sporolactobacillus shoreicorticis]|uniref:Helix-turn-helix domain-containing protein n=1 Tax=Sporolactobacillus shoreicorticis TaxID=1923877 RepID=A0ABW5S024_9BACL|nr:AraC family transcriptional regulator [Sporolactobacillus shoreicorticis]MCO7127483.1 AraC family transcriptional regulator [Sporolactobacillus shoreicorticis]
MNCYSFPLTDPFLYYKSGEFSSSTPWKHKKMYHQGDYEIIICTKGELYIQVGDDRQIVLPNDVLLIPPYTELLGYRTSNKPVDFYWLHFFVNTDPIFLDRQQLMNKIGPVSLQNYAPSINNRVILPCTFHLDNPQRIYILVNQILDVANSYRYSEQENDYLMTAFLIELSHHFLVHLASNFSYKNSKIDKIKEWIRANITETMTVEQVAYAFDLNPDYLTRLFKKHDHRTTLQFINDLKLETAQLLLVRTNLPVKQIATHAYFGDEKNFMRRFKAQIGLTPTEYRNAYTHTHLNNPLIDPLIPLPKQLEQIIDIKSK